MQREIKKEVKLKTIGTKAQNALKSQMEQNKSYYKKQSKVKKETFQKMKFELKQKKKKEKKKGH